LPEKYRTAPKIISHVSRACGRVKTLPQTLYKAAFSEKHKPVPNFSTHFPTASGGVPTLPRSLKNCFAGNAALPRRYSFASGDIAPELQI
jgi:hypothetical protein